jgi:Uma2 family endonuclease
LTINLELPTALPMTAEEFAQLSVPEGVRLELWNGSLDVAAAPQMHWHSQIVHRILAMFLNTGREASAETGVVLGPRAVRAPDVTRFRAGVTPDTEQSQFPVADVDLVVEVLSPESDERDQLIKPYEYAQAGIPEFWLVDRDPDDRRTGALIRIFQLTIGPSGEVYTLTRRVRLSELEDEE